MAAGVEYSGEKTRFVGYETLEQQARIVALYVGGSQVQKVRAPARKRSWCSTPRRSMRSRAARSAIPGEITSSGAAFEVVDTQKIQADVFGHHGTVRTGVLQVGDIASAKVDMRLRAQTMRNHSATHLMHMALRQVLGSHVSQKGSLVDAEKTRFDFSHNAPLTADEIRQVEQIVNREVLANVATEAQHHGL